MDLLLVIFVWSHFVQMVTSTINLEECRSPLGMNDGYITDDQIVASSVYQDDNIAFGAQNSRLDKNSGDGAWCPHSVHPETIAPSEFLQITFRVPSVLTAFVVQGRHNNGYGTEFVRRLRFEYSRDSKNWIRYKDVNGREVFDGNIDAHSRSTVHIRPPIIAKTVRILPVVQYTQRVCLRLELVGCLWEDRLLSYSAPVGDLRGVNAFEDDSYDGTIFEGRLSDGLGQLTDGTLGSSYFRFSPSNLSQGYEWVGWKNQSHPNPTFEFTFDSLRKFSSVSLHTNNYFSKHVELFSSVEALFSEEPGHYSPLAVQKFVRQDSLHPDARWITIDLKQRVAKYVKIRLRHRGRWILLSEVSFSSAPAVEIPENSPGGPTDTREAPAVEKPENSPGGPNHTIAEGGKGPTAVVLVILFGLVIIFVIFALLFLVHRKNRKNVVFDRRVGNKENLEEYPPDLPSWRITVPWQLELTDKENKARPVTKEDVKLLLEETLSERGMVPPMLGRISKAIIVVVYRIKSTTKDLVNACDNLVENAGTVQDNPTDNLQLAKKVLVDNSRVVCEKANYVMNALQAGSRDILACMNAASTVSGIIGDLDTTIMFALAGIRSSEVSSGTFADHREHINKAAEDLKKDTTTLVTGATANQLAGAAQSAVGTITHLSEVVKLCASTLGGDDPEGQVLLFNAFKDVASALGDLIISTTMMASGKANSSNQRKQLDESAKTINMNVTSLLKTVKSVKDRDTRGTISLEVTIDAIVQETIKTCFLLKILHNTIPEYCYATPEELICSTKQVTLATEKAVRAGTSCIQEDIIAASNVARQAVFVMLDTCRGAANTTKSPELKLRTIEAGCQCATSFRELLQQVQISIKQPIQDGGQKQASVSEKVATSVRELEKAAKALKDPDWVYRDKPYVIVKKELLSAANFIKRATKKLSQLRPRQKAREADENLDFEDQILKAANAIANATSTLVKAASHTQEKLVKLVEDTRASTRYRKDRPCSMKPISADCKVAEATQGLYESDNALVQGYALQERLVSSAKQVAACTAQLVVACEVKADIFGEGMKGIQAAGYDVNEAYEHLEKAAQQAAIQKEEAVMTFQGKPDGNDGTKASYHQMKFKPGIQKEKTDIATYGELDGNDGTKASYHQMKLKPGKQKEKTDIATHGEANGYNEEKAQLVEDKVITEGKVLTMVAILEAQT